MAKNNTPLNIEKVVSFIKEDTFSPKSIIARIQTQQLFWKLSESYMKSMI